MDRLLKLEKLCVDPNSPLADKQHKHWLNTFQNFVESVRNADGDREVDKLALLVNYVPPTVYCSIESATTYNALSILNSIYIKPKNEAFAWHLLAIRSQHSDESIEEYFRELCELAKNCNFKDVSADKNRNQAIRDPFIRGLASEFICQRLLENQTLDFKTAYDQARTLDSAQCNSESYTQPRMAASANVSADDHSTVTSTTQIARETAPDKIEVALSSFDRRDNSKQKCMFCGRANHVRRYCPAKDAECFNCKKRGHFATVCRSKVKDNTVNSTCVHFNLLASLNAPKGLERATVDVSVGGIDAQALMDFGAIDSFTDREFFLKNNFECKPCAHSLIMASKALSSSVSGTVNIVVNYGGQSYMLCLKVINKLCADLVLGHDFMKLHDKIVFEMGGPRQSVMISDVVCSVAQALIEPPKLFKNLAVDCKPIATKSRHYSAEDRIFTRKEIEKLLQESIIEPAVSPWRAQVLVTKNERHKKRMAIDYSRTINRFNELNAYPIPRIDEQINKIARGKVFSTLDLKLAYYQVPLSERDKLFIAFEANEKLYQYCQLPFGVENGVPAFQKIMDDVIESHNLTETFAYLDNITVVGRINKSMTKTLKRFWIQQRH